MTIFGPDVSSYEAGLVVSRLADAAFVMAKTTEGTYYTDADYQAWRTQAAQLGKPFVWYHFLSGENAAAQAAHTAANVGASGLPGMLDCEPEGSFKPTLAQIIAYVEAAHTAGLNLRLVYLPRWYWQQLGSPDLSELAALGVHLVSSAYPGGSGPAPSIYPGDSAAGWGSYGGMTPLIYQFTNQASDGGHAMDYNAFRGSIADLQQALQGGDMPLTQADVDAVVNGVLAQLPAVTAQAVYKHGEESVFNQPTAKVPLGNLAHGAWVSVNDPTGPVLSALTAVRGQVNDLHMRPEPPNVAAIVAAVGAGVQTAVQAAITAGLISSQAGATIAQQILDHVNITVGVK